jgi:hypothetical protein
MKVNAKCAQTLLEEIRETSINAATAVLPAKPVMLLSPGLRVQG